MSAKAKEPGTCPFCAWDHPGDPPHSESCCIGPHVEFAVAQGVAEERARIVAWLRSEKAIEWENDVADAIERGEHEEGT